MRRGCVWPISPAPPAPRPRPSSSAIFGSCVVLPEPVSPQTMTTWCAAHRRRDLVAPRADRQRSGKVIGGTGRHAQLATARRIAAGTFTGRGLSRDRRIAHERCGTIAAAPTAAMRP